MTSDQKEKLPSNENKLIVQRREKLEAIRALGEAFPNDFKRQNRAYDLIKYFDQLEKEEIEDQSVSVAVAGRVIRMRGPFFVLQDGDSTIQLYVNNKELSVDFVDCVSGLDLGDIIGVNGKLFKTGKGELTIRIASVRLLTKSLRPLPDKHKGLTDTELRYRQRYVDLIANEDSRNIFLTRSKIIRCIRDYFENAGYIEVETPMMQVIPGGATARPFVTHHNALDQDMYLRVAPELYLKRLIVGGLDRVFELNRNFRNEGLSTKHNPEFTMLEFYQAFASYEDLMDLTEDLFKVIAELLGKGSKIEYQGLIIDFGVPFERLSLTDSIAKVCLIEDKACFSSEEKIRSLAEELNVTCDNEWGKGKVLMEIFDQRVEHELMQPTFITEYPLEVSPLARRNQDNPEITDRFELFIAGREIANGFSELNDSEDQAGRFREQVLQKEAGDNEAMHYDADYIEALEYGMPPTAGEGIGIDRLIMLFTNTASIKDVLLFPHMRPRFETES
ncbi:lysine--tRNA ligase [Gammaproteobacteria bacterium]|nr:lysine--tRNA ligase [Gammaproteobacteria bacterium]